MQTIQKADGFEAQKLLVIPNALLNTYTDHLLVRSFYITGIGFFPTARFHYRERPDGCDTYIFIYCVSGQGWISINGEKQISVTTNTLSIIPANTPHRYGASEEQPWSIYWFHLKGQDVEQFIQHFTLNQYTLHVPATEAMKILDLFDRCYETLLYKGYSFKYYLYSVQLIRHLISELLLLQGGAQQDERKNIYIERAIQYMLEHVQASVTLDQLAEHINLSKPHFIQLFKQVTGHSPIDYYMRLKIQRACQYLDLTEDSIKEVSKHVGINDPYYFSRVFHKIMGMAPSEYRKNKKA